MTIVLTIAFIGIIVGFLTLYTDEIIVQLEQLKRKLEKFAEKL